MGKDYRSRQGDDIVYTPLSMTEQFLDKEYFTYSNSVLEPCCGDNAIVTVLNKKFKYNIEYYDLNNKNQKNKDFFNEIGKSYDYIITNPPYSIWDSFVRQARIVTTKKFAFLGQLNFLNGVNRFDNKLYYNGNFNLRKVYVFTRQANLKFFDHKKEIEKLDIIKLGKINYAKKYDKIKNQIEYKEIRQDGKYPAGAVVYAWYVFENGYTGKAEIDFINNQNFILSKKDLNNET